MLTQGLQLSAHAGCVYTLGDSGKFCVQLNQNGQVLSAFAGDVLLTRGLGNPLEGGLGRMFLRVHVGDSVELHSLAGPDVALVFSGVSESAAQWRGQVVGCAVELALRVDVSAATLLWNVTVRNKSAGSIKVDTVWVQDVGLASRAALSSNEAYTAHYLDGSVIQDSNCGPVLSFRQNLKQAGRHPWLMAACLSGAVSYATDAFDVYGNGYRCGNGPSGLTQASLPNRCYQYEFSCAALQSAPATLGVGAAMQVRYAATYVADHPEASSELDLRLLAKMHVFGYRAFGDQAFWDGAFGDRAFKDALLACERQASNGVAQAQVVHGRDLSQGELQDLFPSQWRHVEERQGSVLSFFCGTDKHVVTRAKEAIVERPHGTILVGDAGTDSMRKVLATTVYMYGVFSAQTVYGNTSFHKMNSLPREPLGLSRLSGMRIYFEDTCGLKVLGTPSVFEMERDGCCWVYVLENETITVRVDLDGGRDSFTVRATTTAAARRFTVSNELVMGEDESDLNATLDVDYESRVLTVAATGKNMSTERGIRLAFGISWSGESSIDAIGGSELLGAQGADSLLVMQTQPTQQFELRIAGSLLGADDVVEKLSMTGAVRDVEYWTRFNRGLDCSREVEAVARLSDTLRWYSHNALIHYASPHGLEQYSGAAWGTRDACQGPLEYFIAQQHHGLARSVLLKTFGNQYADTGDWPQWFMQDEYFDIAQNHSHGDIVVWPLKALALYLSSTGDVSVLDAVAPYLTGDNQPAAERGTVAAHIEKALDRIEAEFIPHTALIRYGGGDWDDSLQPTTIDLAARLVSGWTVALLAEALEELGATWYASPLKSRISILASRVRADFRRYVLIDGQVAGFLLYDEDLRFAEPLLHPNDTRTGIHNRLIPMTRSIIAGLLTREEADLQMERIAEHLKFPDGVRLMDRPAPYSGGLETFFKRAESAANFGREIGLQYVHAHIRYAEALAKLGDGDGFFQALLAICPIGIEKTVPNAEMRQSNMYFSSSDAAFLNRADAAANFDKLRDGSVSVKGGWRLYSSGPGLYSGLVIRQLFGMRESADAWVFDPVLPRELDGIVLTWELGCQKVEIEYRVLEGSAGPRSVTCAGIAFVAKRETNPYRSGGLIIQKSALASALVSDVRLIVTL